MRSKTFRSCLAVAVLLLTVSLFVYYLVKHPSVVTQIKQTPPQILILLLVLYGGTVVAVGLTLLATLQLCNLRLSFKEGMLLTMYSTVINFFGPLQSGPIFRAVYLKKKHGLKLKNYTLATFVYYVFYASFSGLFLISGILKWWLLVAILLFIMVIVWVRYSHSRYTSRLRQLNLGALGLLGAATLLQVCLLAVIYYIEVHSIDPHISFDQAIIYTGAANFSLFVAITPGAIGFREAFLVFSRRLHHIAVPVIVAANVIDRCVYLILLMILVAYIFINHVSDQLKATPEENKADS